MLTDEERAAVEQARRYTGSILDALVAIIDRLTAAPAQVGAPTQEWRCFHCTEVFTDYAAAEEHFGHALTEESGCKLNTTEQGILGCYREARKQLDDYHREDNESYREFYRLGAAHSTALIEAEQKGYDKGLADGRAHPAAVGSGAAHKEPEMSDEKPHNGRIVNWHTESCDRGLKYLIRGKFVDHEEFANEYGHTSYVVSHDKATGEIETRNSRYTLVGPNLYEPKLPAPPVEPAPDAADLGALEKRHERDSVEPINFEDHAVASLVRVRHCHRDRATLLRTLKRRVDREGLVKIVSGQLSRYIIVKDKLDEQHEFLSGQIADALIASGFGGGGRTPGTVEVCAACHATPRTDGRCHGGNTRPDCPILAAQAAKGSAI